MVSCPTWVLGSRLESSGRIASAFSPELSLWLPRFHLSDKTLGRINLQTPERQISYVYESSLQQDAKRGVFPGEVSKVLPAA